MTEGIPKLLRQRGLIDEDQFTRMEAVTSGKIISVFYELRSLLYLGVLLFSGGVGILVYQHIGDLGHLLSIIGLSILALGCFIYAVRKAPPYSNGTVKSPSPYYDYVVLLGCLVFISIQGYLQFRYGWLDDNLGSSTLFTAILFFVAAYRFDHIGVLSLAITALASFWSIQVSPQKWTSGDFIQQANLHITAIIFSVALALAAGALDARGIKKHFTFTYFNFSFLIFFGGTLAALFLESDYIIYVLLTYAGSAAGYWVARKNKSFLFLFYAFLSTYIATTYWLARTIFEYEESLWFYYSIISCGGFVYFIIRFRQRFSTRK
ncbi:MAG: hypothetical protein U0289_01540 [Cyclobacteriaceae bacterium]|jgi:hypothetical protein|nr:hypothetical protein [Cytophagales bacterium]HNP76126.1 hypothetical protein [Cyclobacteriaceae bacterium]